MPKMSRQDVYTVVPMIKLTRSRMSDADYKAYVDEWWDLIASTNPAYVDKERFVSLCYGMPIHPYDQRWFGKGG